MQSRQIGGMAFKMSAAMLILLVSASTEALGACVCRCVDGEMTPLCGNSMEIPPICPPTICQIVPPSIQPIAPPIIPPLGTKSCSQEQVYNPATQRYEWKMICK